MGKTQVRQPARTSKAPPILDLDHCTTWYNGSPTTSLLWENKNRRIL